MTLLTQPRLRFSRAATEDVHAQDRVNGVVQG